jgi:hypothetical protein
MYVVRLNLTRPLTPCSRAQSTFIPLGHDVSLASEHPGVDQGRARAHHVARLPLMIWSSYMASNSCLYMSISLLSLGSVVALVLHSPIGVDQGRARASCRTSTITCSHPISYTCMCMSVALAHLGHHSGLSSLHAGVDQGRARAHHVGGGQAGGVVQDAPGALPEATAAGNVDIYSRLLERSDDLVLHVQLCITSASRGYSSREAHPMAWCSIPKL